MNKVLFFTVFLSFALSMHTSGQTDAAPFVPTWSIGANAGFNVFLSEGNDFIMNKKSCIFTFQDNCSYLGRFSVGYAFTPILSVRSMLGYSQHCWSDSRYPIPGGGYKNYSFGYSNLTADFMVNLSNWFMGANPGRVVEFSIFGGVGGFYRAGGDFDGSYASVLARGGSQVDVRIHPQWKLNLILDGNATPDKYNNYSSGIPMELYVALSVGASYQLKTTRKVIAPVDDLLPVINTSFSAEHTAPQLADSIPVESLNPDSVDQIVLAPVVSDTVPATSVDPKKAISDTLAVPDTVPTSTTVNVNTVPTSHFVTISNPHFVPDTVKFPMNSLDSEIWVNLFYSLSKSDVDRARHNAEIARVAQYLAANPQRTILVTGYGDCIGSSNVNQKISKQRALNVKGFLHTEYGISPERVKVNWVGKSKKLFKQNSLNRLTTIRSQGAMPFGS